MGFNIKRSVIAKGEINSNLLVVRRKPVCRPGAIVNKFNNSLAVSNAHRKLKLFIPCALNVKFTA